MATTYLADIRAAILARIEAGWSATPIAWPGTTFDPAGLDHFLRVTLFTNEAEQAAITGLSSSRFRGLLLLGLFARHGQGTNELAANADAVRDLFPRGLVIAAGAKNIMFQEPSPVAELDDGEFIQQPINCPFVSHTL